MAGRNGTSLRRAPLLVAPFLFAIGGLRADPPPTPPQPALPPTPAASPGVPTQSSPPPATSPDPAPNPPGISPLLPPGLPPGGQGFSGPAIGPFFGPEPAGFGAPQRFNIKIDPNAPLKDFLPPPPKATPRPGPVLVNDLARVPEVEFQERYDRALPPQKAAERNAVQLAKISHLNGKKTDGFMVVLLENRPDLAGLPFAMGDDCRLTGEHNKQFTRAVALMRQAMGGGAFQIEGFPNPSPPGAGGGPGGPGGPGVPPGGGPGPVPQQPVPPGPGPAGGAPDFWTQFASLCRQEDAARDLADKAVADHVTVARIAALMQVLAPADPAARLGLVKYLAVVSHAEATRALARLAVFSAEELVRLAAIDALKVRRERDYTDILVRALRYPWPDVARRASDAITRLDRQDLIPVLVAVLDEADPRLPVTKKVDGNETIVVRELVRVNHHRNCVMCHAPGNPGTVSGDTLTAEVPTQGVPLQTGPQGYRGSSIDLMVRVDVTYLRQDFSAMLPVADAHPWPDAQRFDFLVREREVTAEEAADFRERLTPKEAGVFSPYHRAALAALRDLTGKDTAPTAAAWRELLGVSARPAAKQ